MFTNSQSCFMLMRECCPQLFGAYIHSLDADGECDVGIDRTHCELDDWDGKAKLMQLLTFCSKQFKSEQVKDILCEGAFEEGKLACINGSCSSCGFRQLWSNGLRLHVVGADNELKSEAPFEFESQLQWSRIKSSNKGVGTPGESKEMLQEKRTGNVINFLDEFEREVRANECTPPLKRSSPFDV